MWLLTALSVTCGVHRTDERYSIAWNAKLTRAGRHAPRGKSGAIVLSSNGAATCHSTQLASGGVLFQ